ncbi:MAG: hypothetical protein EBU08_10435 [Micrococcales bacterium]|nr:hypothetical protein [Micrococcales bacterium]
MELADLSAPQRYYETHKQQRQEYARNYYYKNRDRILAANKEKRDAWKKSQAVVDGLQASQNTTQQS